MSQKDAEEKILSFLKEHTLGVISTIHTQGNSPESAVVAFVETENLEIVFGTSNTSRKYQNILKNNHVCLVIGWSSQTGTVQYEGLARELSKQESVEYASLQTQKNPESQKFINREDQRYFMVEPKWIRFLDNRQDPPLSYEVSF